MMAQLWLIDSEGSIGSRAVLLREMQNRANSTARKSFALRVVRVQPDLNIWRINSFMSDAEVEYLRSAYEPHLYPCPFSVRIPFTGLSIGGRVCHEIQRGFPKTHHRLL